MKTLHLADLSIFQILTLPHRIVAPESWIQKLFGDNPYDLHLEKGTSSNLSLGATCTTRANNYFEKIPSLLMSNLKRRTCVVMTINKAGAFASHIRDVLKPHGGEQGMRIFLNNFLKGNPVMVGLFREGSGLGLNLHVPYF